MTTSDASSPDSSKVCSTTRPCGPLSLPRANVPNVSHRKCLLASVVAVAAISVACSKPAATPSTATEKHYYAECNDAGHAPWRSDPHETPEFAEDDVKIHLSKHPGHRASVRSVSP